MSQLMPIAFVALLGTWGCDSTSGAPPDASPDPAEAFAGAWNYDLPDLETERNVAKLVCPAPGGGAEQRLTLPQIGSLTLRKTAAGRLEGATDQGCIWTFEVEGSMAELSPAGQSCYNEVFDIAYTMNRWTLALDGAEQVDATSHNPGGDCSFALVDGHRTRVAANAAAAFAGTWPHTEPDPSAGINFAQVICPSADGPPQIHYEPVAGALAVTRKSDTELEVSDQGGCTWRFDVHGQTAWLSPVPQSCDRADGSSVTRSFWSIAIESDRGFEIVSGVRSTGEQTCGYVVAAGQLRR